MTAERHAYASSLHTLIDELLIDESDRIDEIARLIATSIADDGILHVFGSGHSSLLAQEIFHRAGGLVPVNAMLDVNLTIFGTARATEVERLTGYAASILATYDVRPGEIVVVISVSGVNPVPIEVAQLARERGATVVALVSAETYGDAPSRHPDGIRLVDVADHVLDLHVPRGDAIQQIGDDGPIVGATSTILGGVLLNALIVTVAAELDRLGVAIPAFVSQNIPGGDDHNRDLIVRYRPRIPLMKP